MPMYRQRFRALASAPAIERFYRLVRACCAHAEELQEPFEAGTECDETTISGAPHGKRGLGAAGNVIVLGIRQRNVQVKVFAVPAREGKSVIGLVRAHTNPGSSASSRIARFSSGAHRRRRWTDVMTSMGGISLGSLDIDIGLGV